LPAYELHITKLHVEKAGGVVAYLLRARVLFLSSMGTDPIAKSIDVLVVMVTTPNHEEATRIAEHVVGSRHAACATVVPTVESTYWWEGKLVKEHETLVIFKTTTEKFPVLRELIKQVHPYDVPEIIAVPVLDGLPQYLDWVVNETST